MSTFGLYSLLQYSGFFKADLSDLSRCQLTLRQKITQPLRVVYVVDIVFQTPHFWKGYLLLAQSQGSVALASSLARETGLSETTIARHLEVMAQTYVLYVVPSYSTNLANELKKSRKYYFFDIGIRNALLKDFRNAPDREDRGVLYETAVMLQLIQQLKPNMELRFWRTKKGEEVDFVLVKNRMPVPIEVKSGLSKPEIPPGIYAFLRRYPKSPFAVVFNDSIEHTVQLEGRYTIYFKKWMDACGLEYLQNVK